MENFFERAVGALIDMDGVLYDSMPGHTLAWKRMMDDLGVECTREEFFLYEGMTGRATIDLLMRRAFGHGVDADEARRLYDIKSRCFREMGPAPLMPGADRMLRALKRGGMMRVLVTGSGQKSLLESLSRDYPGMFADSLRVTAHDVTHGKPDPEPYLKGAEKGGISPSQAVVIENAPLGVRAGKAAGCFTVAVTTGPIPCREFEREGADMIFPSMPAFADFLEEQLEAWLKKGEGLRAKLAAAVDRISADKVFLLTDENVAFAQPPRFGFVDAQMAVAPGEGSKDLATAAKVWEWLSREGGTRRSLLINYGGGVVSDLGGFCAATFKRGIRTVNVPTSLLAMADAAIGGKTGIDFDGLKNEIGAFHNPEEVVVAPELLSTLPDAELRSGLAEVIKMALLADSELYEELLEGNPLEDRQLMERGVRFAAGAKERIVALDPKEKGIRRMLNLGHTAGHAYETYAARIGRPISHGEAVAHGLYMALRLSEQTKGMKAGTAEEYRRKFLERYYAPLPFGEEADKELEEIMAHDKKNPRRGEISRVLLTAPGELRGL